MTLNRWFVQRPARGETVCGDTVSFVERDGMLQVALADGLGHGPLAAAASREFCIEADKHSHLPLPAVMERGGAALASTRGAAAALVRIDENSGVGSFVGVGNIELRAVSHPAISVVSRPGIVGRRLPRLVATQFSIGSGAVLVVFSDGISARLKLDTYGAFAPAEWPERILREHGKWDDDVTCVVVQVIHR